MPDPTPAPRPGVLSCPQCGAEAAPESVRCAYCGSSLATIACPSCFGALFVGMKHCPWCGAEASREAPAEVTGKCPRCNGSLCRIQVGAAQLDECESCSGLWIDNAGFEHICADREEQEAVLDPGPPKAPKPERLPDGRVYIPCPVCGKLMHRQNFASCSGVIVDRCRPHGIWFDHQELQKVILFIREGGMKQARAKEKARLKEEAERLRNERYFAELQMSSIYPGGRKEEDTRGDLELQDLVHLVRSLLR